MGLASSEPKACIHLPLFFMIKPHFFLTISLIFSGADAFPVRYTSVFSFGDSLIDTGNSLYLNKTSLFGRFPYGITFFHRPTGRCSDGRVAVDFISEALGIPFLPPFLASKETHSKQLRHGANFAVAGATALPSYFFMERKVGVVRTNISLGEQLRWFLDLLPSLCNTSSVCCNSFIETIFLVGEIGVNDYFTLYKSGRRLEEIRSFVPQVVSTVSSAVESLIKQGATTVAVPGLFPLGCMAVFLTMGQSSNKEDYEAQTGCLRNWNDFSQYHNHLLKIQLDHLRDKHPHVIIAYSDFYNAVRQAFRSPQKFGFSNRAISACCGGGGPYNYNSSAVCGMDAAKACSHPSRYWSWDGAHPTEAAHRLIADAVITKLPAFPLRNPHRHVCR